MNTKDFITKLNNSKIIQKEWLDEFQFKDSEMQEFFDSSEKLKDYIDVDKHRWHETSVIVYRGPDGELFGINSITTLYAECSSLSDFYHTLKAFEVEEVKVISYIIKNKQQTKNQ